MNQTTLEKMHRMRLFGMHRAFRTDLESGKGQAAHTPDEAIAHLIDAEWDDRQQRSTDQRVRNARFRYRAALEGLLYDTGRNMDKNQMMRFADCAFIQKAESILITGSTGIGKSYIASAIGYRACDLGYRVMYFSLPKLFIRLKMCRADGSYLKELARIEKQHLLILDDFGLQPFDAQSRVILMEVVEERHEKGSLIVTSQVPVSKWYDIIGEKTIADAILDRIVHSAHRLELTGESLRKKQQQEKVID